jgi:hypothetical protein
MAARLNDPIRRNPRRDEPVRAGASVKITRPFAALSKLISARRAALREAPGG